MRPVVDYIGSIGFNTSRALADLLGPIVGQSKHHTKNSKDLAKELLQVTIQDTETFNSHDVVSLFTNSPNKEALNIGRDSTETISYTLEPNSQLMTS